MKTQENEFHKDWISLNSLKQFNNIFDTPKEKPIALFKHSTRCGISVSSQHNLFSQWDFSHNEIDFYHLDLLSHRGISDEVAKRTGVIHQSPQLIILKKGKVISVTTHHAISYSKFKKEIINNQ